MADAFKQIVKYKRIYREVIAKLKYRIKANKIVPKDADIIAKKGEYAETEADYNATFKKDEYAINYEPYKYIEYDLGEYGEPVRLMDKNYIDEIFYIRMIKDHNSIALFADIFN